MVLGKSKLDRYHLVHVHVDGLFLIPSHENIVEYFILYHIADINIGQIVSQH